MADEQPYVEVSLEGGGSVRVSALAQIEGTTTRVLIRDEHGRLRVSEWADAEALTAAIRAKLERAMGITPTPPEGS